MRIEFEIHEEVAEPSKEKNKVLIQMHLNFEIRYSVHNNIITHKSVWFNKDQIHPSIARCCKGKCLLSLCRGAEENFTFPEKIYDPSKEGYDPLIGKRVKFPTLGGVTFHDPDGDSSSLDLNWKRLRNMAQPVVDEQLAKLAMSGKWTKQPIRLELGTLLLDNGVIRFDKESYDGMDKDSKKDMLQCEKAWGDKIDMELKKRGITKVGSRFVKYKKWSTVYRYNRTDGDKENKMGGGDKGHEGNSNGVVPAVKKELLPEDKEKKILVAERGPAKIQVEVEEPVEDPVEEVTECVDCCESPCVWLAKKEDMIFFDECEHGHLPENDRPPNNIRRKKLYRQMTLHIQNGVVQKGVRHELPKCVEDGTRELFPSPTFMGFRSDRY
jgi:hypothetical protein